MNEPIFCPTCGGEMHDWNMGIYECEDCGNMVDIEILDELEEQE